MSAHHLDFEKLVHYNAGEIGITVDINLKFSDKSVSFPAKIDTGSSLCIFERKHAKELGLEVESGLFQRVGTATGTFVVFGFRVLLEIEDFQFESLVYFAEDENIRRNVLGRRGWLELVKIGLVDYEGKLYLSRYSD
ncbi:hypothetical protein BH10ACI1_BH10ACI1_14220 [soil metagenome]